MSTIKQYSKREFQIILRNNGFKFVRSSGGHSIYKNKQRQEIAIPSGEPNKMMCRRLIKENKLVV